MERILCPAVWYMEGDCQEEGPINIASGYVVCGYSHIAIAELHFRLAGSIPNGENGFLTSRNRFVSRKEALRIAIESGQTSRKGEELISEDLHKELLNMENANNQKVYDLLITEEDKKIAHKNAIKNHPLRAHYESQAKVLLRVIFITMGSGAVIFVTQALFGAVLLILGLIGLCFILAVVCFAILKIQIPKIKPDEQDIDAELRHIAVSKGVLTLGGELYVNSKLIKMDGLV